MYLANSQGASVARGGRQRSVDPTAVTPPKSVVCVPSSRPLWTQVRPALALSGYEVPDCGGDGDGARDEVFVVQVLRPHGVAAHHQDDSGVQCFGEGVRRHLMARKRQADRLAVHHEFDGCATLDFG